ncbi:MAG: hypothetical protein WCH35_04335 [Comamonadaceae bacterium]
MTELSNATVRVATTSNKWMQGIGAGGTVLALAILGASMLLRLTTVFAPDGHAVSTLPVSIEYAVRLLHRLAASSVALLALGAVVLCWSRRSSIAHLARPTAWIMAATIALALIGPLTPGYRVEAVTVVNVTVGMLLLMAFWWLRESVVKAATLRQSVDAFAWATVIGFLVHVATGAAASAYAMHGLHWPAFVHLGSLLLCIILIGALLREVYRQRPLDRWFGVLVCLLVFQLLLGYLLMWQEVRPMWLSFFHAMLAPALGLALLSVVLAASTRVKS